MRTGASRFGTDERQAKRSTGHRKTVRKIKDKQQRNTYGRVKNEKSTNDKSRSDTPAGNYSVADSEGGPRPFFNC